MVGFALLLMSNAALADTTSIQGAVTGTDGKRLANAEIRADRLDAKVAAVLMKTDAKGQYVFQALPVGTYAITASGKGITFRTNVKTRSGGLAKVDFDFRAPANNKNIAQKPASSPATAIQNPDLSRMQGRMGGNINNMSFPGH
jgi:hypothetical protein